MTLEYIKSINDYGQIKDVSTSGEVCFFGRSNVGKSSLINAIFQQKAAFVSKIPGKTISLNFYKYNNKFTVVDTPGYGFAKNQKLYSEWDKLVANYLKNRPKLKIIYILIDIRRGISENDLQMLDFIIYFNVKIMILYTKIDKLSNTEIEEIIENDKKIIKNFNIEFILVSSNDRIGIKDLLANINKNLIDEE